MFPGAWRENTFYPIARIRRINTITFTHLYSLYRYFAIKLVSKYDGNPRAVNRRVSLQLFLFQQEKQIKEKRLKKSADSCDFLDEMAGEPGAKKTTQPVRWVLTVCYSRCRTVWTVWGLQGGAPGSVSVVSGDPGSGSQLGERA